MKSRIISVCIVWLIALASLAAIYKWFVSPYFQGKQEVAEAIKHQETIKQTGTNPHYSTQINFALDSFSGYSVLRSEQFKNELGHKRIKLELVDDNADYRSRLQKLKSGDIQMAAFPVDALIKMSAELNDLPATIVALIDETRGADAMLSFKTTVQNIDAINTSDMKFILTPDSPSETLARVVISHFGLHNLPADPFVKAKDANDVYKQYRQAKPTDNQVFVLWEPYVTKMLENPNVQILVDSSRFRGYIVDAIVVSRDYLVRNESTVVDVVEAYLRAVYHCSENNGMLKVVEVDAQANGQPLSSQQVQRLEQGIWWKNTGENFAHMGVSSDQPLQHIEDMIQNITGVLKSTGAIKDDPTHGQPNLLYYNHILEKLQANNFHPGIEKVRNDEAELVALNDEDWKKLVPVGTLEVPTIVFARGTSVITDQSRIALDELVDKLHSWPQYYILVKGNASLQGDIEANKQLAASRAKAVEDYFLQKGIGRTRVKALGGDPSGNTSVVFQLGYMPY